MRTLVAALSATMLVAACAPRPDDSHFPLHAGQRLVYLETIEAATGRVERERSVLNMGESRVGDQPVLGRRYDDGTEYWFRVGPEGVERVAQRSMVDAEAKADPPGRYVLKRPFAVGTTWQAPTVPYLLMRKHEFPRELRHGNALTMTYTIEAIGETVEVPAGTFRDCIRVAGVASLKLNVDPVRGPQAVPVLTTEWYAPGVGLVRLERVEELVSPFITGGRVTWELVEGG